MSIDQDAAALDAARRNMVDCQVRPSDVTDVGLIDAMLWAPRERFLPKSRRAQAYIGEHVELGGGRAELDPRVFAKMVDALAPRADDLALVVGAAGGYSAAVLSKLTATVVAVEEDDKLAGLAQSALADTGVMNVVIEKGALTAGCPTHAPYNAIFMNGAVCEPAKLALIDQLAEGGRLVCVTAQGATGRCELGVKSGDTVGWRQIFDATAPYLPGFAPSRHFEF